VINVRPESGAESVLTPVIVTAITLRSAVVGNPQGGEGGLSGYADPRTVDRHQHHGAPVTRSTTALLSGVALTVLAGVLFGIDAASDNDSGGLLSFVGLVIAVPAGMLFFIGGIATAIRWGLADHDEHRLIQTAWDGLHYQPMVED
jgi:hypothetical protein